MTKLLNGKEVAAQLREKCQRLAHGLQEQGVMPRLALIRVGERPDDLYYQQGLEKTCREIGLACSLYPLTEQAGQRLLEATLREIGEDQSIHGMLLFCPLPEGYDEAAARAAIHPEKDVDCLTQINAAGIFANQAGVLPPCTAAAVMEVLRYYQIPLKGKQTVIVGRSQVVGKPLAMLLLAQDATVTICHSQSQHLPDICRRAEIVIAACGKARLLNQAFFSPQQVVIDVGINPDPRAPHKMCGDVDFDAAWGEVAAITPVPGGIGSITSAMLCHHVLLACQKTLRRSILP